MNNNISNTFRALKNRNYRLFFTGQGVSLIGTWMQQVAMSWLVYRLTGSAFMLGMVGFCNLLPALVLFPVTGLTTDRVRKRTILIMTQILAMLQALTLSILVLTGTVAIWHIIFLSFILGIGNAFDMPTRQSFVVEMVDNREDLGNAIALNSSLFNSARLVGPTVAGALISLIGEGYCFLINGISYLAVIISLLNITVAGEPVAKKGNPLNDIVEGIKYTFGFHPIRTIILNLAIVSFAGMSFMFLVPVFAKDILHGDSHTLGLLSGAVGLGALIGSLNLARRKRIPGLAPYIAAAGILLGFSLCAFSFSNILIISLVIMVFAGFAVITIMASSNTLLQTIVPDEMRGRVMSFYVLAFAGVAPLGSLSVGSLAEHFGPVAVVFTGGCITFLGAILFSLNLPRIRKLVRPIYIEKGIIPEIAQGIHSADSITSLQKE
ncbi:MAG: MFS transporter [Spirochaetes bacterium]|nr:MFS transporter [Spirochaetota bacterium]